MRNINKSEGRFDEARKGFVYMSIIVFLNINK